LSLDSKYAYVIDVFTPALSFVMAILRCPRIVFLSPA